MITRSHVYSNWCGGASDWATDGMFDTKGPNTNLGGVPESSPMKFHSSNTTVNLPLKKRNAQTVVKPSIALKTCRSN